MLSDEEKAVLAEIEKFDISIDSARFFLDNPEFKERPVDVRTFVNSPKYLACPEVWPEIQNYLAELFREAPNGKRISNYTEFVFDAGIGSGKSFLVSCLFSYATYWLACLNSPQKFLGLAPKSVICLINTSTSGPQAKKVVFGNIKERIDASPWFQKHFRPDLNVRSELRFPKNIVIFPGSSSEKAPLGYNVFIGNVDEASFFVETEARNSASEIFDVLQRRITSRFGNNGIIAVTSSPRYVDDFTEKKYEESKTRSHILGIKKATWEVRPDDIDAVKNGIEVVEIATPGSGQLIKIPKKYQQSFEKNPRKAWRDFGAIASLALESFFQDDEIAEIDRISRETKLPVPAVNNQVNPEIKPKQNAVYNIHIDLGIVRDACGFAMGHLEDRKVVMDLILRIVCEKRSRQLSDMGESFDMVIGGEQVQIDQVLNLIYDLSLRGFFIGKVTFDNFQSIQSRQQLEERGFVTDTLSVDKNTEAYDTLKTLVRSKLFECCPHVTFPKECRRLELIKGKKVDHAPNASKDCSDAVAGVCKSLLEVFDEEDQVEETIVDESIRIEIQPEI